MTPGTGGRAEPLPLLARGRDADVFALPDGRVLRRYRDGWDAGHEADLMGFLASHGFPVPVVHAADGPDLVLDRLEGPTLLRALEEGRVDGVAGGAVLADLHNRLHQLPARDHLAPATRVLHLDLHPENVVLTPRGPFLIDWRNSEDGEPDLDVAMTAVILGQVAVDEADARAAVVRALLETFLARVDGDAARLLPEAVARRGSDRNVSAGERARLEDVAMLVARLR